MKASPSQNLPSDCKIVLLPASIRKVKDIIFALEAMANVLLQFKSHYFVICGSIREQAYFKETQVKLSEILLKNPELTPKILILDYILYEDFLSLLKETSLVINTSLAEGMPCSIIEAIGVGIPVLVRNIEGNLSIIDDNINGLVFKDLKEFSSQYERIWSEDGLIERIVARGKEKFEQFSSEKEGGKYAALVEKVIRESFCEVNIEETSYRIAIDEKVHKIMIENNEIFNVEEVSFF